MKTFIPAHELVGKTINNIHNENGNTIIVCGDCYTSFDWQDDFGGPFLSNVPLHFPNDCDIAFNSGLIDKETHQKYVEENKAAEIRSAEIMKECSREWIATIRAKYPKFNK